MTLSVSDAEAVLRARLGAPAKPPTDYVVGFSTPTGKVLAIHREGSETRIWFQPPAQPKLDGVRLMDQPSNANSNLNGPLLPLRAPSTLRVEVDSSGALQKFLDWYAGSGNAGHTATAAADIDPLAFRRAFAQFQALMVAKSGRPFATFSDGLIHDWESAPFGETPCGSLAIPMQRRPLAPKAASRSWTAGRFSQSPVNRCASDAHSACDLARPETLGFQLPHLIGAD